jgi:energy-converting hydrogenase Eha subunit B
MFSLAQKLLQKMVVSTLLLPVSVLVVTENCWKNQVFLTIWMGLAEAFEEGR